MLGLAADLLSLRRPAGVGLTASIVAVIVALALLDGRHALRLASRSRMAFGGAAVLLAASFALRTSSDLLWVNAGALALALVLMAVRVAGRRLREMRIVELTVALVELPATCIVRASQASGRLIHTEAASPADASSGDEPTKARGFLSEHGRDIAVGVAIAIPVLAVLVALLASSDAGFARILGDLFDLDLSSLVQHVVGTVFAAALIVIVLIAVLASDPTSRLEEQRRTWAGPAVVWIVLGSTAVLFIAFLALQGAYLFGGPEYLDRKTGLSAAEYAVHGFYELLTVSGIVVAILLALRHGFEQREGSIRAFRIMAPALAALTVVLLGSALVRLWIYQDRFGLTEQRIYAAAVLVWIASVLLWMALRIASSRELQLGVFAASAAIAVVLALDIANPDALAARTNLERSGDGGVIVIDSQYLSTLSEDATPTIVDRLDRLSPHQRDDLARSIRHRVDARSGGWRSSNLAHHKAEQASSELD
ncbi:MAG: hypothetical protein JWM98_1654 [Thermoleophilia bacterium]|nr:hypothetical protein [Thermoleophilia bacterium]